MKTIIKTLIILLIAQQVALAQSGDEFFEKKDYRNAAIRYEIEAMTNPDAYLNLGKSYFALQEFDQAVEAMENYKEKGSNVDLDFVNNFIELLLRDDDYIEIVNMGPMVNSAGSEYLPFIAPDGKRIYFVSKEIEGGKGGEDIWYCDKNIDGTWTKPKAFEELNTSSHEGILSISSDGNVAIVFGNYQGSFGGGDLFYSVKTADGWTMPCNLGGDVNTGGWEAQAKLAPDGKSLLFCSDREGGQGYNDIWVTTLTTNGWTEPINLGPTINTPDGDYWPFMAADMKTLYYFTYGKLGFGGADLFMAKRLDDSWTNWSEPVNLGKYINTLEDDAYLSIPASGTRGYFNREDQVDGFGKSDMYTFILPQSMRPELVFNVYGKVFDEENNPVGAIIKYYDMETNEEKARAVSDVTTGDYKLTLPPYKKYQVIIDMKGYLYYSDILDLTNPDSLLSSETLNDKLESEVDNIVKSKTRFEDYVLELQTLMDTNTTNIPDGFKEYEQLAKQYKINATNLDRAIKRAKLNWMAEEEDELILMKDYQLTTIRIGATFELKNIVFDFGAATLRDESKVELNKLVDIMERSTVVIELGGHTDNVGSDEANKQLSQDRVNSVRAYLVEKGIESDRIAAVGYGEERPIASNETDEGRQKNRRVEVLITDIKPREGADVLTDADMQEEEEAAQFDLLATMQYAAKKGGLPAGSPCGDEARYLDDEDYEYDYDYDDDDDYVDDGVTYTERLDKSNYIYKTVNAHLLNFGYNSDIEPGMLMGAGINFLKDKNLREFYINYYFQGTDSLKAQYGLGWLWTAQFTDLVGIPLTMHIGIDMNILGVEGTLRNESDSMAFFAHLPLGLRYTISINDKLKVAPEFMYVLGHDISQFAEPIESNDVSGTYMRFGVNARWRFVQGGAFYNMGEAINYLGFRAGLCF